LISGGFYKLGLPYLKRILPWRRGCFRASISQGEGCHITPRCHLRWKPEGLQGDIAVLWGGTGVLSSACPV